MPLKKVEVFRRGGGSSEVSECPLGKFKLDLEAGRGGYTADPVEACLRCNFGDLSQEGVGFDAVCQCPADLTWREYDRLRKAYAEYSGPQTSQTRRGFWRFVEENRASA